MADRVAEVLDGIDEANSRDPVLVEHEGRQVPRALLYGQRMSAWLGRYRPTVSDELRIAARAQHIERWIKPRDTYPEGRIGYLKWRKDLQKHHADRTAEIMRAHGYDDGSIERVGSLLRKERLKQDEDVQTLEDVICFVFLEYEAPEFIAKHDDDKVRDILLKTARKMSAEGVSAAATLNLDERLQRLLGEALNGQAT